MTYFVWGKLQVVSATLEPIRAWQPSYLKDLFLRDGVSFTRAELEHMLTDMSGYARSLDRVAVFIDGEPEEVAGTHFYRDANKPITVVLKCKQRDRTR